MKRIVLLIITLVFLLNACKTKAPLKVEPLSDEQRMEWWQDARFGLFIHWGLYAQDGCFWNGQDGRSEHMMRILEIPVAEYEKIASEFNPVKFNATEWVKVAKAAGMRYMVITSKHHDGFAMFDSPSNDYNIVKQTPWKRDPIKELALACEEQGLKFGLYYSLGRDWHDPDCNSKGARRSNTWDFPEEEQKDFSKYFEGKVKPQITELMTQYHPAIIWFDTPELITLEQSKKLLELIYKMDPACVVNQRVGNKLGDYAVKEQKIPAGGEPDPWETCMTISKVWGYHKEDHAWKSADSLVHSLLDIASKGGNLLLNVGPTGDGIIRQPSVELLLEVGNWLKINGESIYGTTSSPLGKFAWGRCTKKVEKGKTILYVSVFDWPSDGKLILPEITNKIIRSTILSSGEAVNTSLSGTGLMIELPDNPPDPIATVLKIEMAGVVKTK